MTDPENNNNVTQTDPGYEKRDINAFKIISFGIGGVVIIVVILIVLVQYFTSVKDAAYEEMVLRPESTALRELRARETEELGSYKLLDAEKGVYRIPIDRAIDLMAEEAFKENQNPKVKKRFLR